MARKIYQKFSEFTAQEQAFLASLPYRVGIWLSYADIDGGNESEQVENEALEGLVHAIAGNSCESAFVMELMEKTVWDKSHWQDWARDCDNVLPDVRRSIELLDGKIPPEDLISYKAAIVEAALAVARAYNELITHKTSLGEKLNVHAKIWFEKFISRIRDTSHPPGIDAMIISEREERAIGQLTEALQITQREMSAKYHDMVEAGI